MILHHIQPVLDFSPKYAAGIYLCLVLAAVGGSGQALKYADEELHANYEIVMTAVKSDGLALEHVTGYLREDRTIILTALRQNGLSLIYAGEDVRACGEMVFHAMQQNSDAYFYASKDVQYLLAMEEYRTLHGDSCMAVLGSFVWFCFCVSIAMWRTAIAFHSSEMALRQLNPM